MEIQILFIDDQSIRNDLFEYFNDFDISGHLLKADTAETFELGIEKIKRNNYDIIVLDLCKGEPSEHADKEGLNVLKEIQSHSFVPVIFYSGSAHVISDLTSEVVGVVGKSDGIKPLEAEITRIVTSNVALLKSKILTHVHEELKVYFWDTIDKQKDIFKPNAKDYSLGYLMLRRLSHSLSKDKIKHVLGDENIKEHKTHPMEFYIYPTNNNEYEAGEILIKENIYYAILTPSCDFIEDINSNRERRAENVLLAVATRLDETDYYKDYQKSKSAKNADRLKKLIETRKGDQFFFLPGTPFVPNLILNFQNKIMVPYNELKDYTRVTKLDDPYAQSMVSSFIRFYNRIGFPDIDADYIISNL